MRHSSLLTIQDSFFPLVLYDLNPHPHTPPATPRHRETMVRTMEILREYCFNDNPVQLEVLSDQTVNFPR